jgi:hypothetical protein
MNPKCTNFKAFHASFGSQDLSEIEDNLPLEGFFLDCQIRFLAANGFYVVLDNQFNLDNTAQSNPSQWLSWWQQLLTDVVSDPASKNYVMLDLLNEPDSQYYG